MLKRILIPVLATCLLMAWSDLSLAGRLPGPFPWGAPQSELIADMRNSDFEIETDEETIKIDLGYGHNMRVNAEFYFIDGGLAKCTYFFCPDENEEIIAEEYYAALVKDLTAQYGTPVEMDAGMQAVELWAWPDAPERAALASSYLNAGRTFLVLEYAAP